MSRQESDLLCRIEEARGGCLRQAGLNSSFVEALSDALGGLALEVGRPHVDRQRMAGGIMRLLLDEYQFAGTDCGQALQQILRDFGAPWD